MRKRYLKLRVNSKLTAERIKSMLALNRPALLKLESNGWKSNNKTIRFAIDLMQDGYSIERVNLFPRFKSTLKGFKKHCLIAVILADETKRGKFQKSEPKSNETRRRR